MDVHRQKGGPLPRERKSRFIEFNDDGTYELYDPRPDDQKYTLNLLGRLSLRLTARRRRSLDPRRAEMHIRCALEQRDIQPELFGHQFSLAPFEAVPVSPSIWLRVAHQDIRQLGIKRDSASWLIAGGLGTVGSLLLHSRDEVAAILKEDEELHPRSIDDIRNRLKECGLRFPSHRELDDAFSEGFWKRLNNDSGELRVASFLVPYMEMSDVRHYFFDSNTFWPYPEWGFSSLGETLKLGEEELCRKWVEYCQANQDEWPYEVDSAVRDMKSRDGERNAREFIDWVKRSGLEFAAQ